MKKGTRLKKSDVDKIAASSSAPTCDKKAMFLKCASLYTEIEEYKEAMKYANQYTKTCPKDPKGYKMVGLLHEKMGVVKEALKAYRRCTELNERDTEAKESVSNMYCKSGGTEQLFRKKAWLEKMEKEIPHSTTTHRLKCHVLQESGRTVELEQYLLTQLQSNSLNVECNRALIELLAARETDDSLYFTCKLNPLLYRELELMQLAFSVFSRHLSTNKMELHMAERILYTCHWIMCKLTEATPDSQIDIKAAWVNYDLALHSLSENLNLRENGKWAAIARESGTSLWLWVPHLLENAEEGMVVACEILALSAPLLDVPHSMAEISLYRHLSAGCRFSRTKVSLPAIEISSIISRHCSSQAQTSVLQQLASKSTSFSANNLIRNVKVPTVCDLQSSLLHYIKLRPRELHILSSVLKESYNIGEPIPVEEVVGVVMPKMRPHPNSLTLTHTLDLCQDDVCALLHLLMKFPRLLTPTISQLWDEICYHTKIISPATCYIDTALLKKGMWALRALSGHGLGPKEVVTLAKYFSHRAALLFDEGGARYEKLQQRSAHYWMVAHDLIAAIQTRTHKRHSNSIFSYEPLDAAELALLAQESALAHASVLVNEGKFTMALDAYQSIETPQAAFNAAQVYLHLAECSNTPRSRAKHRENAELQLIACRERATENQELLDMVALIEDSMPGRMKYVTKRDVLADTPTVLKRFETVGDTPFKELDSEAMDSGVIKHLDFSPTKDEESEDKINEKLQNLSINLQKQLEEKNDEVSFLKNELLKLKDEVNQVRNDVSQMNSPRQQATQPAGVLTPGGILTPGQGPVTHRTATPLWMRNDLPTQQSPGSPLVVHHPTVYQTGTYPPAAGSYPGNAVYPPALPPYPFPTGSVPLQSNTVYVPPAGTVPGYPAAAGTFPTPPAGFGIPAFGAAAGKQFPPHMASPSQLQFTAIPLSKDVPVAETYPNVSLSDTLEPSALTDTRSSDAGLLPPPSLTDVTLGQQTPDTGLMGMVPAHNGAPALHGIATAVLASTPLINRTSKGVIFDSSAIKLPDTIGTTLSTHTGKFSCEVSAEEKNKKPAPQTIEPGYFARLLDQSAEQEDEDGETGSYHEDSDPEPDTLEQSQYFKEGTFTAAGEEKLQRSHNSNISELDNSTSFLPQVSLTELTERTSGEENEECVFDCRAKLYRFFEGEWKERGIGELKLLRDRVTSQHRVVMRRDFVLNICANHLVTRDMVLEPAFGSDKAWVWFSPADMANEVPEPQQLAARFKTKEIADSFKQAFDKCKGSIPQKQAAVLAPSDIEVVWELKASESDIARARALQLPDTFFLTPRSGCPGCVGCESDDVTDDITDDDVVFVKEVLPPTPLKKLAEQYQLPPYFYNKRNSSCEGCAGCMNDDDFHDNVATTGNTPNSLALRPESPEVVFLKEVLPATPLKQRAEQYMLPPSFYNVRYGTCRGCPGCHDDADYHTEHSGILETNEECPDEVEVVREVLPPTPLKDLAAHFKLPTSFYNRKDPCTGCVGCEEEDDEQESEESVCVVYEKPGDDAVRAALYKLPPNFFDIPDKPCPGCLGCPDPTEDIYEISYQDTDQIQEEEEEERYFGCGKSDPNEPISEKPLYDDLWPEEIQEEDKGQFFSPSKQGGGGGNVQDESGESAVMECGATLSHFDTRRRGYFELGMGSLAILSSNSRVQYRLTFHDSDGQLHASHAIEGGMYVESVPDSHKFLWFVPIDYTDPDTPIPRKFMVELDNEGEGEEFRKTFMDCSEKMKGHVVNHKLVSLLAAGSPRKEMKVGQRDASQVTPVKTPTKVEYPSISSPTQIPSIEQSEPTQRDVCANLKLDFDLYSKEILEVEQDDGKPVEIKQETEELDWSKLLDEPASTSTVSVNKSQCSEIINRASQGDTSVEIIKEVLPPPELRAKEGELLLPKGFYNYVNKSGCSGCDGCDEGGQCHQPGEQQTGATSLSAAVPSLYQALPALNPLTQDSPFGLKPSPPQLATTATAADTSSQSTAAGVFGLSPSQPIAPADQGGFFSQNQSSIFSSHGGSNLNSFLSTKPEENIFLKSETKEVNIFAQQGGENFFQKEMPKEENIFAKSMPEDDNIFLRGMRSEENIFARTHNPSQPAAPTSESGFNPFLAPTLPAKAGVVSGYEEDYENEDDDEYLDQFQNDYDEDGYHSS